MWPLLILVIDQRYFYHISGEIRGLDRLECTSEYPAGLPGFSSRRNPAPPIKTGAAGKQVELPDKLKS